VTATAAILRDAANRLHHQQVANPVAAIRLAAHAATSDGGDHATNEALAALAAHLAYGADRDPRRELARWATITPPADMVREMNDAADEAERGTRG
jgi:hypothetical protein